MGNSHMKYIAISCSLCNSLLKKGKEFYCDHISVARYKNNFSVVCNKCKCSFDITYDNISNIYTLYNCPCYISLFCVIRIFYRSDNDVILPSRDNIVSYFYINNKKCKKCLFNKKHNINKYNQYLPCDICDQDLQLWDTLSHIELIEPINNSYIIKSFEM